MYTVPPPVVTFVVIIASNYFLGEEKDTRRDPHEYIIELIQIQQQGRQYTKMIRKIT